MYRLFSFIKRYNTFFLFVLLQILAFSLLFSYNNYHHSVFFSSFQETAGFFQEKYHNTKYFFRLKSINDSLLEENARLREIVHSNQYDKRNASRGFDTNSYYCYTFKQAYVISNSIYRINNFFTVNIGKNDSITEGMAVITTNGIAGIVRDVSSNYALVLSVLNPDFHVNAKIKELDELGSVTWDGKNRQVAVLNDIPSHVKLKKGQKVVVGPYSKYFPEDYPIGVVEDFELDETGSFFRVRVKLNTVVRNLEVVYIIDRSGIDEQENLEKEVLE